MMQAANAVRFSFHVFSLATPDEATYLDVGNLIESHEHTGDFKEWYRFTGSRQNRFGLPDDT
jgi:hypothetical protein